MHSKDLAINNMAVATSTYYSLFKGLEAGFPQRDVHILCWFHSQGFESPFISQSVSQSKPLHHATFYVWPNFIE